MARRTPPNRLPAPFLRRVWMRDDGPVSQTGYPFDLPWVGPDPGLEFEEPVTILVGENGSGKSTLIEAVAALAGFGEAGGSRDHGGAARPGREGGGARLADAMRAGWLPKVTAGWFFRAESFFSVARYLDDVNSPSAGFLSASHGEGFARVFAERMSRPGLYLLDEPESALSPSRQLDLLRQLDRVQRGAMAQVVMATHSPILMAVPGARLLQMGARGPKPVDLRETSHFRLYHSFTADPDGFVAEALQAGDAG